MTIERHPTELDQLIATPPPARKPLFPFFRKKFSSYQKQTHRNRLLVLGVGVSVVVFVAYFTLTGSSPHHHHGKKKEVKFKPRKQVEQLDELTESSIESIMGRLAGAYSMIATPISDGSKSETRSETTKSEGKSEKHENEAEKKSSHQSTSSILYQCTSHLIIMRHCEKEVTVTIHGKDHTTDKRDFFGDRHCNAHGKARSAYIPSLFVDPEENPEAAGAEAHVAVGANDADDANVVSFVPVMASSGIGNTTTSANTKPQFPAPLKLYALSPGRYESKYDHQNYHEIETVGPLAKKFNLDVDDRFGVKEEGELATDYFESLSGSVAQGLEGVVLNLEMLGSNVNGTYADSTDEESKSSVEVIDNSNKHQLCQNGVTVVNWKHSRIPKLARALGCGKGEGCPKKYAKDDFDTVWVLTFQYSLLMNDDGDVSKSSSKHSRQLSSSKGYFRKNKDKKLADGTWSVVAQLVNEGFVPED